MAITTTPKFYYISGVTSTNNRLDFSEGGPEINATVTSGQYSLSQLMSAGATAFQSLGSQVYTLTLDRDTRTVTISAAANFELLPVTGANNANSFLQFIGFTTDRAGSNSYVADVAIGSEYIPLFPLQNFRGFEDNEELKNASVNESANQNVVEVISFGANRRQEMSFNIRYLKDQTTLKDNILGNNANMVQDTRDFLSFIIGKGRLEFMKDRDDSNTFDVILLDRTSFSRIGTKYELRELYDVGLGYYETGLLTFRKIN